MATNNSGKSKAEEYREERKKRLAQEAKRNSKGYEKRRIAKKRSKKIGAIVAAVVIFIALMGLLFNALGVYQRVAPTAKINGDRLSIAEYEYYYRQSYNYLIQMVNSYSQSGYNYGYDTSLAPDEQTTTTKDENDNDITWEEYLIKSTEQTAKSYISSATEAEKMGIELSDADKKEIDKTIEELRETAAKQGQDEENKNVGYSLNAYLRMVYGKGANERFVRKQMKIATLAQKFYEVKGEEFETGYTDEEIKKEYEKDKSAYDVVDVRLFVFEIETLTAEENESDEALAERQKKNDAAVKKEAQTMFDGVKDLASFIALAKQNTTVAEGETYDAETSTKATSLKKSELNEYYGEDAANWAFESGRKDGEKKLVEVEGKAYIIMFMENKAHSVDTVDVRHILFKNTDDEDKKLSENTLAEKKASAENILADWQKKPGTEEDFEALAYKHSEDSVDQNGGLYATTMPGRMVENFDKWIFDEKREPGETALVETEYGYHVMYFVSKNGVNWNTEIRAKKAEEEMSEYAQELMESDTYAFYKNIKLTEKVRKTIYKDIKMSLASSNSGSGSGSGNQQ